jgi:hypothetical protein
VPVGSRTVRRWYGALLGPCGYPRCTSSPHRPCDQEGRPRTGTRRHLGVVGAKPPRSSPIRPPPGGGLVRGCYIRQSFLKRPPPPPQTSRVSAYISSPLFVLRRARRRQRRRSRRRRHRVHTTRGDPTERSRRRTRRGSARADQGAGRRRTEPTDQVLRGLGMTQILYGADSQALPFVIQGAGGVKENPRVGAGRTSEYLGRLHHA